MKLARDGYIYVGRVNDEERKIGPTARRTWRH